MSYVRCIEILCVVLLCSYTCSYTATHYCDPATGRISNAGTAVSPWSTLKEVVDSGKIETRQPVAYPYIWGQPLAIKNAGATVKAGDTILLRGGYHGDVHILKAYNTEYITVAAQPGHIPRLKRLTMTAVSKWRVAGLAVSPVFAVSKEKITLIAVESHGYSGPSREVTIENCRAFTDSVTTGWDTVTWKARSCNGISVSGKQVVVRNNKITNIDFGISVSADSVLVEGNEVDVFDGDGLRGVANDLVFRNNRVTNCIVANGANHDDGFQSWSVGDSGVGTGTVYRISLIGNTFINYTDPALPLRGTLQGIGCFDGMFEGWVIENNVVITDHWHGITLLGAKNCRIVNNTVLDMNSLSPGPPWIMIDKHKDGAPSSGCVIRNNLATDVNVTTGVTEDHNIIIRNTADYFADATRFDLRLKAGCTAIDSGSSALAPAIDIAGTRRPQGAHVDVGAYEYLTSAARPVIKTKGGRTFSIHCRDGRLIIQGQQKSLSENVRAYSVAGKESKTTVRLSSGLFFVKVKKGGGTVPVVVW